MVEKDLNRILVRSFNDSQWGWGYKIPDDANNFLGTSKKPFDYIGIIDSACVYGESKLIKGLHAFNFHSLREHQIENLSTIHILSERDNILNMLPVVSVGFWESRKFFYVLFFHISFITNLLLEGTISFKKKDIELFIEQGKYLSIKKDLLDISRLKEVLIIDYA